MTSYILMLPWGLVCSTPFLITDHHQSSTSALHFRGMLHALSIRCDGLVFEKINSQAAAGFPAWVGHWFCVIACPGWSGSGEPMPSCRSPDQERHLNE